MTKLEELKAACEATNAAHGAAWVDYRAARDADDAAADAYQAELKELEAIAYAAHDATYDASWAIRCWAATVAANAAGDAAWDAADTDAVDAAWGAYEAELKKTKENK